MKLKFCNIQKHPWKYLVGLSYQFSTNFCVKNWTNTKTKVIIMKIIMVPLSKTNIFVKHSNFIKKKYYKNLTE